MTNIDEGNKLIMVFDGWTKTTRQTFDPEHNGGSNTIHGYEKDGRFIRDEDIEFDIVYHQSWNDLMPVVKKINKLNDDNGDKYFQEWLDLIDNDEPDPLYLLDLKITEPITNVYKAVVQFIQWLNNQKTNRMKDIKDYLPYYLGCEAISLKDGSATKVLPTDLSTDPLLIKLKLCPLPDMSDEVKIQIALICGWNWGDDVTKKNHVETLFEGNGYFNKTTNLTGSQWNKIINYCRKQGIDMDDLIESGLAIDKTKL